MRSGRTKISVEELQSLDQPERRRRTRFPIELRARYVVEGSQEIERPSRTVNISSGGLLLTSADKLALGASIRVVVEWPVLIGESCPLALHIRGKVVRSGPNVAAVRFSSYELRTQAKSTRRLGGLLEWLAKAAS